MRLDEVNLLTVQFVVQKGQTEKLLSRELHPFKKEEEDVQDSIGRRIRNFAGNGEVIVSTKDPAYANHLPRHLGLAGFTLVGCWWQERKDKRSLKKTYLTIRFTFARELRKDANEAFVAARSNLCRLFVKLASNSFWGVRIHKNPLFEKGVLVPGQQTMSINLDNRRERTDLVLPSLSLSAHNGDLKLIPTKELAAKMAA